MELACGAHDGEVDSIVASTGLLREEAALEMGCPGYNGVVDSIVQTTGLLREEAALKCGCHAHEAHVRKKTKEERSAKCKHYGRMGLGKGTCPQL